MSLKLYGYWRSSASWRVRWAANLRGVSLEHVFVNLKQGSQKSPEFLKVNPSGFVPFLETSPSQGLSQSLAQILHIESLPEATGTSLLSSDSEQKIKQFELWEIIAADTHPVQNLSVQMFHSDEPEKRKAWAQHFIARGLRAYNAVSESVAGKFSLGDTVSLPDLALIPQIYNALRFGVQVEQDFPLLFKIYEQSLATPECFQAAPEQQSDAVLGS